MKSAEDPRLLAALKASEKSEKVDTVTRKIRSKIERRHERATEVITKADSRRTELARRSAELTQIMQRGQADVAEMRRAVAWYEAELPLLDLQVRELEGHAADLESHAKTILPTAPLYGQYLELQARCVWMSGYVLKPPRYTLFAQLREHRTA